jgi:protein TonB
VERAAERTQRLSGIAVSCTLHLLVLIALLSLRSPAAPEAVPTPPLMAEFVLEPPLPERLPEPPPTSEQAQVRLAPAVTASAQPEAGSPPPSRVAPLAPVPIAAAPSVLPAAPTGPLAAGIEASAGQGIGGSGEGIGAGADGIGSGFGAGTGKGGAGGGFEKPDWITKPTKETARYIPWKAKRDRVAAKVMLRCLVNIRNRAHRCKVVSESPSDYGFGAATLQLSKLFQIKPPVIDGQPRHDIPVDIPIQYNP